MCWQQGKAACHRIWATTALHHPLRGNLAEPFHEQECSSQWQYAMKNLDMWLQQTYKRTQWQQCRSSSERHCLVTAKHTFSLCEMDLMGRPPRWLATGMPGRVLSK